MDAVGTGLGIGFDVSRFQHGLGLRPCYGTAALIGVGHQYPEGMESFYALRPPEVHLLRPVVSREVGPVITGAGEEEFHVFMGRLHLMAFLLVLRHTPGLNSYQKRSDPLFPF